MNSQEVATTTTYELVYQQEQFFSKVLTSDELSWQKECQFAIQALDNNEFLAKVAMQNQSSFQNAIINVAAVGISLNPALKHAYLVPRKTGGAQKVCLDISYQGLLHLAMSSGSIEWGQAKLVYENDHYENMGVDKQPVHQQQTFGVKGDIIGAYCTVKTKSGDYLTEEMDLVALKKVQGTSNAANGPWKEWPEEMMRKTVVKRASKYWPSCEPMQLAVDMLNADEGLVEKDITPPKPVIENPHNALTELVIARGTDPDLFIKWLSDKTQRYIAAIPDLTEEEAAKVVTMMENAKQ